MTLGIANAGQGVGTALIPPFTQFLVSSFGWRWAYVGLGLIMVIPFLFNLLLLRDKPADKHLLPDGARAKPGPQLNATSSRRATPSENARASRSFG